MKTWTMLGVSALLLAGCGPDPPETRYSGNTMAAREVAKLKVFRAGNPDRPFVELGNVEVSCPTAFSGGPYGSGSLEGGCTFDEAVGMASTKAAASGADAIYGMRTSAAANGSIVSLIAVAVRFTGPKAAALAPAVAATTTVEERLQKLKQLNEQKLITDEEFSRRKAQILEEL
jgi:hypothetical protein